MDPNYTLGIPWQKYSFLLFFAIYRRAVKVRKGREQRLTNSYDSDFLSLILQVSLLFVVNDLRLPLLKKMLLGSQFLRV